MKVLFTLVLFFGFLVADGFTTIRTIKKDTPIDKIVKILENAPNGTVIEFEYGIYELNKNINISNKKMIDIETIGNKPAIFKNTSFTISSSDSVYIKSINLEEEKSYILFENCTNCLVSTIKLNNSYINIKDNSSVLLYKIYSYKDTKYIPIYISKNSTSIIIGATLQNKLNSCIFIEKSNAKIQNSKISLCKNNSIQSKGGNILIINSEFDNNERKYNNSVCKMHKLGLTINGKFFPYKSLSVSLDKLCGNNFFLKNNRYLDANISNVIVIGNKFSKTIKATVFTGSKVRFYKNKFIRNNYSISLFNSNAIIEKNDINNILYIRKPSYGIYLDNSYADILSNSIKSVSKGVGIYNNSQSNIINNIITNLMSFPYKKEREVKYIEGYGIYVSSGCRANILNNKYNSNRSDCGWAAKRSLVFLRGNDKGFSLPGWGDPQVSKSKIPIEVEQVTDFTKVFDKIQIEKIDYKSLRSYNQKSLKQTNLPKIDPSNLLKGYLDDEIIVTTEDGDEEVVDKGTYMVVNKNTSKIIEPKEYQGLELDIMPSLSVSAEKRKIDVHPTIIKKNNGKYYVQLDIQSNVDINEILLNGKKIKFKNMDKDKYQTVGRRIKKKYFGHSYSLMIKGLDFDEMYECKVESFTNISCEKKENMEL